MTEIDRRQVVTGLAAVAVAGVTVPVLPARAAAAPTRRDVVLRSRWHYHEPVANEITLRHLDTGLTFVRRPSPHDHYAMTPVAGEIDPAILVFTSAARFVALSCCMILTCRPQHQGAVLFRYRPDADPTDPYYDPITEDAPPLPRFA